MSHLVEKIRSMVHVFDRNDVEHRRAILEISDQVDALERGHDAINLLRRLPLSEEMERALDAWREKCPCACAACHGIDVAFAPQKRP